MKHFVLFVDVLNCKEYIQKSVSKTLRAIYQLLKSSLNNSIIFMIKFFCDQHFGVRVSVGNFFGGDGDSALFFHCLTKKFFCITQQVLETPVVYWYCYFSMSLLTAETTLLTPVLLMIIRMGSNWSINCAILDHTSMRVFFLVFSRITISLNLNKSYSCSKSDSNM